MIKKAIIDIDNTLWHFCDALHEQLMIINSTFPPPDDWTDWDMWEGFCSLEEFLGAVNAVHLIQDSDRHQPYPEAQDFLSSLKENGYHITIASHRSPQYKKQTEKWLETHGLVYDELHLSYHKTRLFDKSTDVVVDDAPQVLEKAVDRGVVATGLLFPWNREFTDNGFRLFDNLNEILEFILKR
jgi:5' nucleotidase, deoxy (Pyrimidine), cytosolic type C protein (NT5C)